MSHAKLDISTYYRLWMLYTETAFLAGKIRKKELSKNGITMEQVGILFDINTMGNNVPSAELWRRRGRERNTMSEALSTMARKGLIIKEKDSVNKNQIRIQLTEKGRTIIEKLDKRESVVKILSCFTKEEFFLMEKLCNKIHERVISIIENEEIPIRPLKL